MNPARTYSDAVVTPHHLSTQAGLETMALGGNAIDAAIAANAVQGVVAPETCGIGGDLFALVWTPDAVTPATLNASGWAGSNADAAALRSEGHATMPMRHPSTVTIPGCVAGWFALHEAFGHLPFETTLAPAVRLATDGFPASNEFARATAALATVLGEKAVGSEILRADASPHRAGDAVRRHNLATSLRRIADGGPDAFYTGAIAERISESVGDILTVEDLAAYRPSWVTPLAVDVFGVTGWTVPANSQGYLTLATLAIFERVSDEAPFDSSAWWHLLVESFRAAAYDRDDIVADPDHEPGDIARLLSAEGIGARSSLVDPDASAVLPSPGKPPGGTAYLCTLDRDGMGVSLIQSNYWGIGTGIGAGDAGFVLHNRGGGFDLREGHPNELAPGKRPLHTLSPTLWTRDGRLDTLLGTRGGNQQPQLLAQVAARLFGTDGGVAPAVRAPRWTIDPDAGERSTVLVEDATPNEVVSGLELRGHVVRRTPTMGGWGPVAAITVDSTGMRTAMADPRVDTASAGVR